MKIDSLQVAPSGRVSRVHDGAGCRKQAKHRLQGTCATLMVALTLLFDGLSAQAEAKPSYAEAREAYGELEKTVAGLLLWDEKTYAARGQALKAASEHHILTQNLMGEAAQCAKAASLHKEFVTTIFIVVANGKADGKLSTLQLLRALGSAEQFGIARAACFGEVLALDPDQR